VSVPLLWTPAPLPEGTAPSTIERARREAVVPAATVKTRWAEPPLTTTLWLAPSIATAPVGWRAGRVDPRRIVPLTAKLTVFAAASAFAAVTASRRVQ
jgi:hypothetical protein